MAGTARRYASSGRGDFGPALGAEPIRVSQSLLRRVAAPVISTNIL